jgi:hypothetical protein
LPRRLGGGVGGVLASGRGSGRPTQWPERFCRLRADLCSVLFRLLSADVTKHTSSEHPSDSHRCSALIVPMSIVAPRHRAQAWSARKDHGALMTSQQKKASRFFVYFSFSTPTFEGHHIVPPRSGAEQAGPSFLFSSRLGIYFLFGSLTYSLHGCTSGKLQSGLASLLQAPHKVFPPARSAEAQVAGCLAGLICQQGLRSDKDL